MSSKQTKRALFSSFWALLLCFAMLLGTTFAWFTDTASTSVNKIQAGTLDIELQMKEGSTWVNAEGKVLNFIKAAGHEAETVLWEPGATYKLPEIKIVNKGNLALKYEVYLTATGGDLDLAKVLKVSMNGVEKGTLEQVLAAAAVPTEGSNGYAKGNLAGNAESAAISISMTMDPTAGNEYQNKTINGIAVTVVATQDTVEYDSIDDQYDKDAEYPAVSVWDGTIGSVPTETNGVIEISTAEQLAALSASVNDGTTYEGKTIKLTADIDLAGKKWTPIGLYCATKTSSTLLHKTFNGTFDGQGHTIYNMTTTDLWGTDTYITKGAPALFGATGGNVTIKNLTVKNALVYGNAAYSYAAIIVGSNTASSLTFENVHVKDSILSCTRYVGGFVGITHRGSDTTVKFSNCSMTDVTMYYVHGNYTQSNVYGALGQNAATSSVGLENVTETRVEVVPEKTISTNSGDWKYYYYKALFENMQ